jgi:hypothetical protein
MRRKQTDWDKWARLVVLSLSGVATALVAAYAVYSVVEKAIVHT